jgi:threonine/homoserine/homoserine lactone efflux protein
LLIVGIIASIGVAALIVNSTVLYQLLRWGGIIYLLWLAWSGWHDDKETSAIKLISTDKAITFFTRGLITNLLNPKAFIFYIAILPEFLMPEHVFLHSNKLTLIYVMVATTIHSIIVLLAAQVRCFFDSPARMQLIRRILALLLVLVVIWLALETRYK